MLRWVTSRSSHQRFSVRKGVLRNFTKFTRKHLYQSLFSDKVAGLIPWHRCFPVNFAKFLRTPFLQNTSGRLLLYFIVSFKNGYLIWEESSKCFIYHVLLCWKLRGTTNRFSWWRLTLFGHWSVSIPPKVLWCFRGYRNRSMAGNGLKLICNITVNSA